MRYLTIPDIRETRTWRNPNAARLYMYMAMVAASMDGGYKYSRRWTCKEVGITEDAYRHALKVMEQDGLIRVQHPREHPREHPSQHPSPPPHITVVSVNELYGSNPPSNPPSTPPSNPPSNPPIYNINKNKKYTLTHARACAAGLIDEVGEYIHTGPAEAKVAIRAFLDAMSKKGKVWEDESDFRGHLMDWTLKRWMGAETRTKAANMAEHRRIREDEQQQQQPPEMTEDQKRAELLDWLHAATRSQTVLSILDTRAKNGTLYKDSGRQRLKEVMAEESGLREQLEAALGYDICTQTAIGF